MFITFEYEASSEIVDLLIHALDGGLLDEEWD